MEKTKEIRTRFAPSPTGELHIGALRTALSDFLYARKNNGKFILRIEDTDQSRLVEGAVGRFLEMLEWAGVVPDEGVLLKRRGTNDKGQGGKEKKIKDLGFEIQEKGDYGPYIQSKRLDIYKKYIQQLIDEGKAYYCFCTSERLDEMRKKQQAEKKAPKYDRKCLDLSKEEVEEKLKNGEKCVVRFKVPEGKTVFNDLVYGKIEVENSTVDDQIILKSDGFPTYHLAVVVDDYLMKISHVFRGAEWISSTPKHILLYEAFGWEDAMPEFAHMPNILGKDGKKKLSKREGSVSVKDFKDQGYPAEAVVNFIALLGWNPKTQQEIFTMEELVEQYDIKKVNRAGAVFDIKRLDWISAQHIKRMSVDELYGRVLPFLKKKKFYGEWYKQQATSDKEKEEYVKKVLMVEKDRLEKLTQAGENNKFFFSDKIETSADSLRWKDSSDDDTKKYLAIADDILKEIDENNWTQENIEEKLLDIAGEKRGDLLFPLRAALTGQDRSPSPFEVAWVIGKERSLQRIENAIKNI
ncbi:MAG: glutamate--tRNA ligase [Candidatus Moranbacteria bacterium]|jgi:nondiscriminating glutamyl-tRNA synthetase|nr:glutamate--tRNA ligase [Candidatus Moranbacteria bacterium]MDX9855227.1 glutamate--tRNA ligase [Candidatus Moranbacteria bacterium]